jgi:hypothetical protein
MWTSDGRLESSPTETRADDGADGSSPTELAYRRATAEKDPASGCVGGAVLPEVRGEGLADLGQQGKAVHDVALPPDDDLSRPPPDVVELESGDLSRA